MPGKCRYTEVLICLESPKKHGGLASKLLEFTKTTSHLFAKTVLTIRSIIQLRIMKNVSRFILMAVSALLYFSCSEDESIDTPTACFDFTPSEAKVGDEIEFSNCSESSTDFFWDFGDGTTSTQEEPTHTYTEYGEYEVKLLAGTDINADGVLDYMDEPDSVVKTLSISPNVTSVELTVYDANSWTADSPTLATVADAEVKFYTDEASVQSGSPSYTAQSDENGKVVLYDLEAPFSFFIMVQKGDASNIKDGLIIGGVFETQAEVDSAPMQDDPRVGGLKYLDINADGVISADDQMAGQYISLEESSDAPLTKNVFVGK